MNKPLCEIARSSSRVCGRFLEIIAVAILALENAGCASKRPAPLLVQQPVVPLDEAFADQPLSLKLVTYNIWGLPSWMTGAPSGRYPKIARELERMAPDVVLLQEVWTSNARKAVGMRGQWSMARAVGQNTFFQQSGLITLSRFPIVSGEFHPFSRSAFPDSLVNKGALKITLRLPGNHLLNVWNVHLQDGGAPEIRLSQIHELISRVKSSADGQIADIVGGDFNCTPDSAPYRELTSAFGPSVQQNDGSNPFITWDGLSSKKGVGQTLDYIFVRMRDPFQNVQSAPRVAFAPEKLKDRLSDHLGIEASVRFTPNPTLVRSIRPFDEGSQFHALSTPVIYAGENNQ